jgi:hypothetical protein
MTEDFTNRGPFADATLLKSVTHLMANQKEKEEAKLLAALRSHWEQYGEITDKTLLVHVGYQSGDFYERVLAEHPARKLADSVENVRRTFNILKKSRSELVDLAGCFHYRLLHDPPKEVDYDIALREATKEVYTYANAAESLVQAYRHMVPEDSKFAPKYEALKKEIIGENGVVRFFKDLRNSNNHIPILEAAPHYNITRSFSSGTTDVSSGLRFNSNAILAGERWSPKSKALASEKAHLQVLELVSEHFKLVSEFYDKVMVRTGIHNEPIFRDYQRIQVARKSMSHRLTLAIILQAAVPKKLNPYEYLHTWFTEQELKRIYALPDNSREQLEYMISLKDPLDLCDADTRGQLYKLFSVAVPS